MKTPDDKTIHFAFASHPTKSLAMRWKAVLTFPPGAGPEDLLTLKIDDGEGEPVAEGTFEIAGQRLAVRHGEATISYADFVHGKHSVALWLYRPGMLPIPGGLTFA